MSQSESQGSFLDEVGTWSKDTCKLRLSETLPKLISQYGNGYEATIKTSILKLIVGSFLPCLEIQNIEEQVFAQILPQTCQLFDDTLSKVKETIKDVSTQQDNYGIREKMQTFLQIALGMIESLGSCISYVIDALSGGALSLDTVRTLPSSVLHVVSRSFHHCKDSNTIYGDHFPHVSEILSLLFKKAYGLQKSLTVMLDAVKVTTEDGEDSEECIEAMAQLCSGFHDLCVIIGDMDSTLLVSTWRFVVKMVCKHKEPLKNVLQIHPIVVTLCSDIKTNYEHCLRLAPHPPSTQSSQGGDERAFTKTLKICSLCLKMLMHLLKEFQGYLGPCQKELYNLIIHLQSLASPGIHAPTIFSGPSAEIDRTLLICIEPLLQLVIDNQLFRDVVTAKNQELADNLQFGRLLTLVKILKMLPSRTEETKTAWMDSTTASWEQPRDSVMQALFRSYKHCYVESALPVKLPVLLCQGQPQQEVSLRTYLTINVCGFVAAVSTRHFNLVERCLLENVLGCDFDSALLAMDVWCFLARYGSANLCASHVHHVADLLTSIPANHSPGYIHLSMFLWRLVPLMAQEHQDEMISKYLPEKNLALWRQLPLLAFREEKRTLIAEAVVSHGLEQCEAWLGRTEHTLGLLQHLESALSCIFSMYRQFENTKPPIRSQLTQKVQGLVVRLWEALPLDRIKSCDIVCTLINLTGLLLTELSPCDLGKVTKQLCTLQKNPSLKLRLDIVNLLHRFRKVKVQPCSQLKSILDGVTELFSSVLSDKNCIIRQMSLQAFSKFAEETAHESVVPECLHVETTQNRVVDFLNQTPQDCSIKSEVEWLQHQAEKLVEYALKVSAEESRLPSDGTGCEWATGTSGEQESWDKEGSSRTEEPAAKRSRMGHNDEGYRQAIEAINTNLKVIQELRESKNDTPPLWLKMELHTLRDRLVGLVPDS